MSTPYRVSWRRRLRRFCRHPVVRLAVVATLAAATAITVAGASRRAEEVRAAWGEDQVVVIATRELVTGDVVAAGDVTVVDWPAGLVPDRVVTVPPVGRTVSSTIGVGEPVVDGRLAPAGVSGLAALVPAGWRALAVPVSAATVPLEFGDRVDLLATLELGPDAAGPPTFPVAAGAVVLAVGEQAVTVAVPEADAARVAFAISTGTVIPALRGGGGR